MHIEKGTTNLHLISLSDSRSYQETLTWMSFLVRAATCQFHPLSLQITLSILLKQAVQLEADHEAP